MCKDQDSCQSTPKCKPNSDFCNGKPASAHEIPKYLDANEPLELPECQGTSKTPPKLPERLDAHETPLWNILPTARPRVNRKKRKSKECNDQDFSQSMPKCKPISFYFGRGKPASTQKLPACLDANETPHELRECQGATEMSSELSTILNANETPPELTEFQNTSETPLGMPECQNTSETEMNM